MSVCVSLYVCVSVQGMITAGGNKSSERGLGCVPDAAMLNLWFHFTCWLRSEVAVECWPRPLWASLPCAAHKACLIAAFFAGSKLH